ERVSLPSRWHVRQTLAHNKAHALTGSAAHAQNLGIEQNLDALVAQNLPHLFSSVGVFARHELGAPFDDGHAAAEAAIDLRKLEADIAAAEHDEMLRQRTELESLDMSEGLRGLQPGSIGNCRACSRH